MIKNKKTLWIIIAAVIVLLTIIGALL